jgi:hypothetical protein
MQRLLTGRTRPRRVLPVAVAVLLAALALPAAPSRAAGTGGIEVTPVPSMRGGKAITTFTVTVPSSGTRTVPYTLRNVDAVPRTVRVFAAQVTRSGGTYTLGAPGTSPYVRDRDRTVTLQGHEVQQERFTVTGKGALRRVAYAAVVVEVRQGSVVQNAATLITLRPASNRVVGVPRPVVAVALALLVLAAAALLVVRRRQASDTQEPATPSGMTGSGSQV